MRLGTKYIQKGCCLIAAFLLSNTLFSRSTPLLADDGVVPVGEPTKMSVDNVRVLKSFEEGYFSGYQNVHEMSRWSGILPKRIAEYVTNQRMPDSPPPLVQSANSGGSAQSSVVPQTSQLPVLKLSPVAWSIKVANLKTSFLPQLREEVIVLVRFTPEYFKGTAIAESTWILAHLRNSIRQGDDLPIGGPYPSDSLGRWDIALTPKLLDSGAPESSRLEKTPNIRSYKARPTDEQVSEFVYATDFGNNDIYSYTSVSGRMDVDVLRVVVYPDYATLADALRRALTPETIAERKTAYQESFRRDQIRPSPGISR